MNMRQHTRQLPPTRRLYIKVAELNEAMHRLVEHDGSPVAIVRLGRVERRFWPLEAELLRRLDERDVLVAERDAKVTP